VSAETILLTALGAGFAGWLLENMLFGPRYSYHLPGVPWLPVYAVGGAAVATIAPRIGDMNIAGRAVVYGATLTAIEGTAGTLERAEGRRSWDYGGSPVDLPHAAAWAGLGLVLEGVLRGTSGI
jgi:hypothetical protein